MFFDTMRHVFKMTWVGTMPIIVFATGAICLLVFLLRAIRISFFKARVDH